MSNAEKLAIAKANHTAALEGLREAQAQYDRAAKTSENAEVLKMARINVQDARRVLADEERELNFLRFVVSREPNA
ncbi:hypothetical protein [Sagittula sp.]|uniref:hypothetical protein n=1 Tax=Sagittula sp. TaxID=2038081 RepID=UPI0035138929